MASLTATAPFIRQGLLWFCRWIVRFSRFCKSPIGLVALAAVTLAGYAIYSNVHAVIGQKSEELRWGNGDVIAQKEQQFNDLVDCTSDLERSELMRKCILLDKEDYERPTITVYSSPSYKPAPAPVTLKDLSDSGQAHAIDLVAKEPRTADKAWAQLTKISSSAGSGRDPYRVDRVLVATVTKGMEANPGDRFLWTRIFVQPINFLFAGYPTAATDNQTARVMTIENTKGHRVGLDVGLDPSMAGLSKADVSQSIEQSHKVTADVNSQYERLGVDIKPDFLRIIRESAMGGDVAGNTIIELSITTDPTMIRLQSGSLDKAEVPDGLVLRVTDAHLTDGINYLSPQEARITILPEDALPHCHLKANVWMLYESRHISRGWQYYTEGRQDVQLIKGGALIREAEIVPADDIAPAVWSIQMYDQETNKFLGELQVKTRDGSKHKLVFTDFAMAGQLIHWLKVDPSPSTLREMEFPDYRAQKLVPHKNTENGCRERKNGMYSAR